MNHGCISFDIIYLDKFTHLYSVHNIIKHNGRYEFLTRLFLFEMVENQLPVWIQILYQKEKINVFNDHDLETTETNIWFTMKWSPVYCYCVLNIDTIAMETSETLPNTTATKPFESV